MKSFADHLNKNDSSSLALVAAVPGGAVLNW
jgi:hypothetical protein